MAAGTAMVEQRETFVVRHPVGCYFALAFTISWLGALAVAAPKLARGQPMAKFAGLMMFPIMMLGPSLAGIAMTKIVDGRAGLRDLFSRMHRVRVLARWYAALLIPPTIVLSVLVILATFVSPVFLPNRFFAGISFGLIAGFFEEIGWTGFALPKMPQKNLLASSVVVGLLWAVWHLPVVDYLGTSTPHGAYWFRYFLAFAAAMTAMRVLIAWVHANTNSVVLAQMLHASSTGALVVLSPPGTTAAQETSWYAIYAAALWIGVTVVFLVFGKSLVGSLSPSTRAGQLPAGNIDRRSVGYEER